MSSTAKPPQFPVDEDSKKRSRGCRSEPSSVVEESVIEIRPVFAPEDFGAELTPKLRAQEDRLRAELERQHHS